MNHFPLLFTSGVSQFTQCGPSLWWDETRVPQKVGTSKRRPSQRGPETGLILCEIPLPLSRSRPSSSSVLKIETTLKGPVVELLLSRRPRGPDTCVRINEDREPRRTAYRTKRPEQQESGGQNRGPGLGRRHMENEETCHVSGRRIQDSLVGGQVSGEEVG